MREVEEGKLTKAQYVETAKREVKGRREEEVKFHGRKKKARVDKEGVKAVHMGTVKVQHVQVCGQVPPVCVFWHAFDLCCAGLLTGLCNGSDVLDTHTGRSHRFVGKIISIKILKKFKKILIWISNPILNSTKSDLLPYKQSHSICFPLHHHQAIHIDTTMTPQPPTTAKPPSRPAATPLRKVIPHAPKRPRSTHAQSSPYNPVPTKTYSRPVALLTGNKTPASLVPTHPIPTQPSGKKPVQRRKWQWVPFHNSARKDGLQLKHWDVVGRTPKDYTFARFNKSIRMVTYTDAEYAAVLEKLVSFNVVKDKSTTDAASKSGPEAAKPSTAADADGAKPPTKQSSPSKPASPRRPHAVNHVPPQQPWTKEETDMLFSLCLKYDLRFIVIHDRWPDKFPSRSVDELKDRYYSVAKAIIDHRGLLTPKQKAGLPLALQKHCQAINMNPFDYEYESIRKNQLDFQYRRSKAELREEEETVREARRIEANRKRLAKERQRLAKLLTAAGEAGAHAGSIDGRKGVDSALAAAAAAVNMPQKTFPHRKTGAGAYARSSMIYTPVSQSARTSRRIDEALNELGVGTRPTPTTIVVDNFDLLRMDILAYIELQRTVLRKEEDTHMLRIKLARLKGDVAPVPPPGVTLSHKKRRADDVETGSLFGGPATKVQKGLS